MHPMSPYGISKASSFWTVNNYRESYNLFCCCGVLFNHESYDIQSPAVQLTYYVTTMTCIKSGRLRIYKILLKNKG